MQPISEFRSSRIDDQGTVVVAIYDELAILSDFEAKTHRLSGRLTVRKLSDAPVVTLREKKIGKLEPSTL
jgi:hypothetical protein